MENNQQLNGNQTDKSSRKSSQASQGYQASPQSLTSQGSQTEYKNLSIPRADRSEHPDGSETGVKATVNSLVESFNIDETLDQIKSYAKTATDFAKKRPMLVLSGAFVIGVIGAMALVGKKKVESGK